MEPGRLACGAVAAVISDKLLTTDGLPGSSAAIQVSLILGRRREDLGAPLGNGDDEAGFAQGLHGPTGGVPRYAEHVDEALF